MTPPHNHLLFRGAGTVIAAEISSTASVRDRGIGSVGLKDYNPAGRTYLEEIRVKYGFFVAGYFRRCVDGENDLACSLIPNVRHPAKKKPYK
jgi:hypothetical protein